MINICSDCWNRIFGTNRIIDDFFLRRNRARCDFCGQKKRLINGLVDENSKALESENDVAVSNKPYRTATFDEAETLRHAIRVVRLHRQALQSRRLPKLPDDSFGKSPDDDLEFE